MDGQRYRPAAGLAALVIAGTLLAGTASAASFPRTALSDGELAGLRGGLEVAGLRMDLTARMRTYIDQRLAAATEMQITRLAEGKAMMTQRLVQAGLQAPATATDSSPSATTPPTVTTQSAGESVASRIDAASATPNAVATDGGVAPAPVTEASPVAAGRTVTGQTRVDHIVNPRQVVSTITNTADNRSIHHAVELELRIHNFSSFAARARDIVRARALGRALSH